MQFSYPCSFKINSSKDILTLEKHIRFLLNCEGHYCSFLQSADYVMLKLTLTKSISSPKKLSMFGTGDNNRVFYIPKTSFVICILDDNKTVIIRDHSGMHDAVEDWSTNTITLSNIRLKRQYDMISIDEDDKEDDHDDKLKEKHILKKSHKTTSLDDLEVNMINSRLLFNKKKTID